MRNAHQTRVDPRQTFQLLRFTISTGDDDLRTDSNLRAHLTFRGSLRSDCALHGPVASGGAANITWDNHSTHDAAPCRLVKALTLVDLRQTVMALRLESSDIGASPDNWNVVRVVVSAYNPGAPGQTCVFSVAGRPAGAAYRPEVKISDFPNKCP